MRHFIKNGACGISLRHLLVRRGVKTGEILVDLVTSTQTEGTWKSEANEEELLEGWKEELLALDLEGTFCRNSPYGE